MSDQEALREELRNAIHGARRWSSATPDEILDAVLPVLQRRETELIEKWAHSLDHWGGAIKAVDWWMGEHAALIEKIEALADELDKEADERLVRRQGDRITHGFAAGFHKSAQRLRAILPTQGDTE
jgi:hypothetical protein